MALTFNLVRAMVLTYSQVKVQGQSSVGSEDRVETNGHTDGQTDGRTDGGDCITYRLNAVGKTASLVTRTTVRTRVRELEFCELHDRVGRPNVAVKISRAV